MILRPVPFTEAMLLAPLPALVAGMPNAVYQRQRAVSQSHLKAFRKSPFHYFARHEQPVPAIFDEDTSTEAMFGGELMHCMTLEPDEFDRRYLVGPSVSSKRVKAWSDFVAAHPDRVVITPRQFEVAQAQAASVRRLDPVAEILTGGRSEISAFWTDPATGILCRCRPDRVNDTFGTPRDPAAMLLDLKSTTDASDRGVQQAIARYGYHHQGEWYSTGYAAASGVPVVGFVFAFVESEYPFAARTVEVDAEAFEIAARENREALDALARCRAENSWPGYSTDVEPIGLPRWAGGTGEYY